MQQRDYLLREIEKIGILLRWILGRLIGKEENLSLTTEAQKRESRMEALRSELDQTSDSA